MKVREISKREPFRGLVVAARAAEEADPEADEVVRISGEDPRREVRTELLPLPKPPKLAPRGTLWSLPRIVTDVHLSSHADGPSLLRPPRPPTAALFVDVGLEETVPRFRRPGTARDVFRRAVEHYQGGALVDARTDALLAAVYDPDNPVYRRAADRWAEELRRAEAQARWKS